jgi:hypothetical protein
MSDKYKWAQQRQEYKLVHGCSPWATWTSSKSVSSGLKTGIVGVFPWVIWNRNCNPASGSKATLSKKMEIDWSFYVLVFEHFVTFTPHFIGCIKSPWTVLHWKARLPTKQRLFRRRKDGAIYKVCHPHPHFKDVQGSHLHKGTSNIRT